MKNFIQSIFLSILPLIVSGQAPVDYLLKSKAFVDSGDAGDAITVLTEALQKYPQAPFLLARAEANLAKGDYSAAISDLNSANNIEPACGEFGLARIYALRGDAATAVYHLELSMKSEFRKSEKEILLDPSFSLVENRPEWRQFWKKEWYNAIDKGISEIEYDISTGNIDEAKKIFKQIESSYSGNEKISYSAAIISIAESKYPDAIKVLTGLINEYPGNEKYIRLMAKAQKASGNYAGAITSYTSLFDLNIGDPEILLDRAECFRRTGEINRAIEDAEKYIQLYPRSSKALSFAGKAELANGDNIKAIAYFTENIHNHPNDPGCFIDRANSYFISRSWNWAIQDYGMALDLQPENAEAWLNKGIALINTGKTEDACFNFRKSFSLGNRKSTEYLSKYCIK